MGETPTILTSAAQIPDLGVAREGDQVHEPVMLLLPVEERPVVRRVPQRRGGELGFIDQIENPASVMLRPGGVFGVGVIISGQLATVSEHSWSLRSFDSIARVFRKHCTKIKSYLVGWEASQRLADGARLTFSVKSPPEYDLVSE